MKKSVKDTQAIQKEAAAMSATAILPKPVHTSVADVLSMSKAIAEAGDGSKLLPNSSIETAVAATVPPGPLNIAGMRLTLGYGESFSVKKLLVTVPVKKPGKTVFFRVRDGAEWEFPALILTIKETNESYLVTREIAETIPGLVRGEMLYLSVDRNANPILINVPLPDDTGRRNNWHESLLQAVIYSKTQWVRVSANMSAGCNNVQFATNIPDEPHWPEQSMDQLVEIAFRGKIITDISHPLIQGLLGLA
ncbi:MAG: hypothetical protein WC742_10315 [Gallionellaceae bacterium]|jgi:hypothetical protein